MVLSSHAFGRCDQPALRHRVLRDEVGVAVHDRGSVSAASSSAGLRSPQHVAIKEGVGEGIGWLIPPLFVINLFRKYK